jgi:hypothetical protein
MGCLRAFPPDADGHLGQNASPAVVVRNYYRRRVHGDEMRVVDAFRAWLQRRDHHNTGRGDGES